MKHHRLTHPIALILLAACLPALAATFAAAQSSPEAASSAEVEFFSGSRIQAPQHAALLRSPAIEVQYMYDTAGMKHYAVFNFGAVIPVLSVKTPSSIFETGAMGGIFSRFEFFSESFNFVTADFMGGGYAAMETARFIFDASVYHVSSHLGDEYILYDRGMVVDTGYEAARACATWMAAEWLSFSAGGEYRFGRRPGRTLFFAGSVLFEGRIDLRGHRVPLFFEATVEVLDLYRYVNAGARLGVYLRYLFNGTFLGRETGGSEPHELSVTYYYGFSRACCFARRRESLILVGPSYRF
jgi:hypothetical protein